MRNLVLLLALVVSGCAGRVPHEPDPAMDAVVLGTIMNRPPVGSTYQPPVMAQPRAPVQCYRFGNMMQCY